MTVAFSGNDNLCQLAVTGQQLEEFKTLVIRATNTWDNQPDWIRRLHDMLLAMPVSDNMLKNKEPF